MALPPELQTSIASLRAKHAALIEAVQAYREGSLVSSRQTLLDEAAELTERLEIEEHTLLGQIARASNMSQEDLAALRRGERPE